MSTTNVVEQKLSLPPELLKGVQLSGYESETTRQLIEALHVMKAGKLSTLRPLLPLFLSLKGKPFSLERHFPFEPFYRTRIPRRSLFKAGRQVAKSTSLAARGIIRSATVPFFTTLYITPLFEMVRRFSQNYVGPFIDQSPVRRLLTGKSANGSVLQRSFTNNSKMLFSFAFLTPDRTRGISSDCVSYDEVQDLDISFLPIIDETMSGSDWRGLNEYGGTPKGLENAIESLWQDSSQAEWCIKCLHCNYWNVPALSHDLDDMIGPWRENIAYDRPAVICAKCRRMIYPQLGRWVHARPERRWNFAGYHIPQIIMPFHYGDVEKWGTLVGKREGRGNTPVNVFYNEVCGESYDTGSRIVTITELKQACLLPWDNTIDDTHPRNGKVKLSDYIFRVLACDWGGGGEDELSYTVYAAMGMLPSGKIDVIYGFRSLTPHDHAKEARILISLANIFDPHVVAHDYTGAGSLRETLLVQAGYPMKHVLPIAYIRAAASSRIMTFKQATKNHPRDHYQVDKARSLLLTCHQIKNQWIRFFRYDYRDANDTGLVYDFLGLVDEKVDSRIGRDVYTIIRDPNMRDDFAQAVNIGACAMWHSTDKWPNVAAINALQVPQSVLDAMHPMNKDVQIEGIPLAEPQGYI